MISKDEFLRRAEAKAHEMSNNPEKYGIDVKGLSHYSVPITTNILIGELFDLVEEEINKLNKRLDSILEVTPKDFC